jgi:hypothetical protein
MMAVYENPLKRSREKGDKENRISPPRAQRKEKI